MAEVYVLLLGDEVEHPCQEVAVPAAAVMVLVASLAAMKNLESELQEALVAPVADQVSWSRQRPCP